MSHKIEDIVLSKPLLDGSEKILAVHQNLSTLLPFNIKHQSIKRPELELTFACLHGNVFHPWVADNCETHVMQLLHLYQDELIL